MYAGESSGTESIGFGIKGDTFKEFTAIETAETMGMEALGGGADYAAGNRKGTGIALGGRSLLVGGRPVGSGDWEGGGMVRQGPTVGLDGRLGGRPG